VLGASLTANKGYKRRRITPALKKVYLYLLILFIWSAAWSADSFDDVQATSVINPGTIDVQEYFNEKLREGVIDRIGQPIGGNIVDFFRYDYKDVEDPGYLKAKISFVLSSNLYETAGGTLVYSIETVTTDKNTDYNSVVFDVIENTSVKIGQRLLPRGAI